MIDELKATNDPIPAERKQQFMQLYRTHPLLDRLLAGKGEALTKAMTNYWNAKTPAEEADAYRRMREHGAPASYGEGETMELTPAQERIADKVLSGKAREDFRSFTRVLSVRPPPYDPTNPDEHAMSAWLTECLATELRPPPEHADKYYHWLLEDGSDNGPDIYEWSPAGMWLEMGHEGPISSADMTARGYRYLGPAEWREDNGRGRYPTAQSPEMSVLGLRAITAESRIAGLERDLIATGELNGTQARRIYELEAENRKLRDYAEMHRAGYALAQAPLLADNSGPVIGAAFNAPVTQTIVSAHTVARGDGSLTCMITNAGSRYYPEMPTTTVSGPTDDPKPTNPTDEIHQEVERVIGHIAGGKVTQPARKALRGALDKAEAPPQGRAASDAAIGRISKMESAAPLPMGVMR